MAKFKVVLELEVSPEKASKVKDEVMSDVNNDYIEQEIQWLNQSFDHVHVASIERVIDRTNQGG
jgi:hypothetical protein